MVGEEAPQLQKTLDELGIRLKKDQLNLDTKPLLKLILGQFFGDATGFVDMCVQHIPSPVEAAPSKVIAKREKGSKSGSGEERKERKEQPSVE